jgi:hypothetical protein
MAGIKPVFDELAGERKNASIELTGDRKIRRNPHRRRMLDLQRVANAAEHLERLPARGETWHLITAGGYSLWHFVPAVLQLAAPATIRRLAVATLGFSGANLEQLLQMLDDRRVAKVDFLFSVYFKSVEKTACERLVYELDRRGQRVACVRTHAKLLLLELTDRTALTIESSANLRSCNNIEQSTLTNDKRLLDFHRGWMDEVFQKVKA